MHDSKNPTVGDALRVLEERFGFLAFRPGQEAVVCSLLDGRSALAVFPTGGGKSLCYQLPALLLDGVTLVVSPLIALMKDQVDTLVEKGVAAARLDSTLGADEVENLMGRLRKGGVKLLYVAPERLANQRFRDLMGSLKISLLAVDEAHCISEWGHNFRPDYLKVAGFSKQLKIPRVLALTATATPAVSADISARFNIGENDRYQTSFHRPNLSLRVTPCALQERDTRLVVCLKEKNRWPAIVYVTLQQTAEQVAAMLRGAGVPARPYHAGLTEEFRSEVQEDFMGGELPVVVATIAFGMGIDKGNIRSVIHYNLPKSLENYVQETGRAGRDGRGAVCEMLACGDDLITLENFIYGDTPGKSGIEMVLRAVLKQGEEVALSAYELSGIGDIRPGVLGTVLANLELRGFLVSLGAVYTVYKVHLLRAFPQVLAGFDSERKAFLETVFEAAKHGRKWVAVDIDGVAEAVGESGERIRQALDYLAELGDAEIQRTGVKQRFEVPAQPDNFSELCADIVSVFERREAADIGRVGDVVSLAESPGCLTRYLLDYFGETMVEDCGNCSSCLSLGGVGDLPRSPLKEIDVAAAGQVREVVDGRHPALRSPRQIARFLCGIRSPAATRARLGQHDLFGILEDVPFPDVLAFVSSMNLG